MTFTYVLSFAREKIGPARLGGGVRDRMLRLGEEKHDSAIHNPSSACCGADCCNTGGAVVLLVPLPLFPGQRY